MRVKAVCLALLLLGLAWLIRPEDAWAPWTCWGPLGSRMCVGISTDNPPVPFFMLEYGGSAADQSGESGPQRYYYWLGTTSGVRGKLLASHHATVEAGLSTENIRQGNISLNNSLGVVCVTLDGCLNDVGP